MKSILLSSLIILSLTTSHLFAQKKGDLVLVTGGKTDIQVEGKVLKTLYEGFELDIKDINGSWYWVNHKGTLGWVNAANVKTIDQAIGYYTNQIARNPTSKNYRYRGDAFRLKKKYLSAISDYNESIRLNPRSARTFDSRSKIYSKLGNKENAFADINAAIQLDPNSATRFNNRAVLLSGDSRYPEAIQDYSTAIRLNPKKAIYYKNRGLSYKKTRKYEKAIKDFTAAIRLVPTYAEAYTYRADSYNSLKNYSAALNDYNKSLKIDPKDSTTNYKTGLLHQNQNQFQQAIQYYNAAIKSNPKYRSAYRARGICYRKRGNYSRALQDLDKAIQLSSKYTSAYRSRAWLYSTASDPSFIDLKKANADLAKAQKITSKKSWQLYQSLAALYAAEGKFDQAVEANQKSLALLKETSGIKKELIQQSEARLKLYQQNKPFREIPQNN